MPTQCEYAWAENQRTRMQHRRSGAALEAPHPGDITIDLTNEYLVGQIHEQTVLQHTGDVVDGQLESGGIGDATVHLHVKNEIALVMTTGPALR